MAFTVDFEPGGGGLRLLRSPIMATTLETDASVRGDESFFYFCRVQAWAGAQLPLPAAGDFLIAELVTPPRPDNYGAFNIGKVLEGLIPQGSAPSTSSADNGRIQNCRLRFGYYLDGVATTLYTGDAFFISEGWAPAKGQGINDYANRLAISDGKRFMLETKVATIVNSLDAWVHVFTAEEKDRRVVYRDTQNNPFTVQLPANTRVWRLPIGVNGVNAISDNPNFDANRGFRLQLEDSITTAFYDEINVNVVAPSFCDMAPDHIAFINRYGVWEYLLFRGRLRESLSRSPTAFNRRISRINPIGALVYESTASRTGVVESKVEAVYVVNTGFMSDPVQEAVRDLFTSLNWYSIALGRPLILSPNAIELMSGHGSDIVNYEIEFKADGGIIQDIQ